MSGCNRGQLDSKRVRTEVKLVVKSQKNSRLIEDCYTFDRIV